MTKKLAFFVLFFSGFQAAFAQLKTIADCRNIPQWARSTGFNTNKSAFSTNEKRLVGIAYIELGEGNAAPRVYQHPSWLNAGNMGAIAIDAQGNGYAVPAPKINLLGNKPEDQNMIWRVDTKTQEMTSVINLPKARPANSENPYGLMGLVYDCERRCLFAASISGSDRPHEVGRIFSLQTNLNGTIDIIDTLGGIDVLGIGLVYMNGEKRLFFAKARTSEVFSIGINTAGKFMDKPRLEVSIEGLGPHGDDRARKIRFNEQGEMTLSAIEFFYNLSNPPNQFADMTYVFKYDAAAKKWQFVR